MTNPIYILLAFFISGLLSGVLFDIFRVSRKAFKIPNILVYIEDVLFWILTGAIVLFTIFTFTDGQIRLYMILVMILGAFIYLITLSKYFIIINTKIINLIKSIIKLLILPLKKIQENLKKLLNFKKNFKK
ncbi:MAG: spore cortex biosynthesis protein YabQ [Clostridia bacterium]|nr:spore cortex biosynthesis protein YabQ [Clostridia bacterium]